MHYTCKYFEIRELVDPATHAALGDRAWQLLDAPLLQSLDALREAVGPITINNWAQGGSYSLSGFRPRTSDVGAEYSQHRLGRAFDLKFRDTTPQAVYQLILSEPGRWPGITTLENISATPTWLHVDGRNASGNPILIVNP